MFKTPFDNNIESVEEDMADFETVFAEREMAGSIRDLNEANIEWQALGCPNYNAQDELLAYSINAILQKFDPGNEGKIFQTRFYKLLYLLNDDLREEGVDLKCPIFGIDMVQWFHISYCLCII